MGWLWTIQLGLDAILLAALWRLFSERRPGRPQSEQREETLHREDFEHYHEAMSDLCERLSRESQRWLTQLEQKTRTARQVAGQLQQPADREAERPVARACEAARNAESETLRPAQGTGMREEVQYLRSQGYTIEQIARRLQMGKREVQLMLSLEQWR